MKKKFREFEDAREFVRSLGLKTANEWREYSKSGNKPDDIPSNLYRTYKNKGWKSMGNWLGTGTIQTQQRHYKKFEDAREFVRSLGLNDQKEWNKFKRTEKIPQDIPHKPELVYKNKGWKGMGNWLGTGTIATFNKEFCSFKEAREFVLFMFLWLLQ